MWLKPDGLVSYTHLDVYKRQKNRLDLPKRALVTMNSWSRRILKFFSRPSQLYWINPERLSGFWTDNLLR